jgi:hypothetical protein
MSHPLTGHRELTLNRILKYVIGFVVAGAMVIGVSGCGTDDESAIDPKLVAHYTPALADYRDVPLPTEAPPKGALVQATSFADPAASGQHIAFQYPGFTVDACTVKRGVSDNDACEAQDTSQLIRTEDRGKFLTTYTVSTKFGEHLPKAARTAVTFFKDSALETRPTWMSEYVDSELKERFQE